MAVKPIPDGYHSITPYLVVPGVAKLLDFLKQAFGAELTHPPMTKPDGTVMHAEVQIGDSRIMMADEFPEMGFLSPLTVGGSPVMMHLYVEDVDATANKAVAAGAKVTKPVADQFYGDRGGQLQDPFGHNWYVSTHKEDVSPEEVKERSAKLYGGA